jgi:hypothetical protein
MLRSAWHNRAFHVIVADPGAGKTTSMRDLQKRAGGRAILAAVTPKNNDDEQADAATNSWQRLGSRSGDIGARVNPKSWDTCINQGLSAW